MPKHLPKPSDSVRSRKLLENLIKKNPTFLAALDSSAICWKSPIDPDYAEFSDGDFLDQLEVTDTEIGLREFWPSKGPVWDGLGIAINSEKTRILVEAKAYIEEADTNPTGAGEKSKELIDQSLSAAREFMKATGGHADWSRSFYQYANRLAHLYYLQELNSIPTELWFIYFCDLPDESLSTSKEEWEGAIRLIHSHLGLKRRNPHRSQIREFFIHSDTLESLSN